MSKPEFINRWYQIWQHYHKMIKMHTPYPIVQRFQEGGVHFGQGCATEQQYVSLCGVARVDRIDVFDLFGDHLSTGTCQLQMLAIRTPWTGWFPWGHRYKHSPTFWKEK